MRLAFVELWLGAQGSTADAVREWLIAAGTVGAVLVALLLGPIRDWLRRPKLDLDFDVGSPDAITVEVDLSTSLPPHPRASGPRIVAAVRPSHWLRVRVSNAPRRRSASGVLVLLTDVVRLEDDEEIRLPLDTMALRWSNLREKKKRAEVEIPPGVALRVDIAALRWAQDSVDIPADGTSGAHAELQVIPWPSAGRHLLQAGRYRLELTLCARDVTAKRYEVILELDGTWWVGGEVWQHFRLRQPRRSQVAQSRRRKRRTVTTGP